MMVKMNGDAPMRYRIKQSEQRWVLLLSKPDMDASVLRRWIQANGVTGEIVITVEWRHPDGGWRSGPALKLEAETV